MKPVYVFLLFVILSGMVAAENVNGGNVSLYLSGADRSFTSVDTNGAGAQVLLAGTSSSGNPGLNASGATLLVDPISVLVGRGEEPVEGEGEPVEGEGEPVEGEGEPVEGEGEPVEGEGEPVEGEGEPVEGEGEPGEGEWEPVEGEGEPVEG